jgi:hypothetical protein
MGRCAGMCGLPTERESSERKERSGDSENDGELNGEEGCRDIHPDAGSAVHTRVQ